MSKRAASTRAASASGTRVSNADRVFFPEAGVTKGEFVDYYRRIAPRLLPYLQGRPLTLQRFPQGIGAPGFIQQRAQPHFPTSVGRVTVAKEDGTPITHPVCDTEAALLYLANQGVVTPHVWLSRVDRLRHPNRLIFDLDPPDDAFAPVCRAAHLVRSLLEELGLPAFVMTTGSSGLHVVVPLDQSADFDFTHAFARDASTLLARRHPDALTVEQRKKDRQDRVFLDYLRNTYAHTAVPPYAVRARAEAPVATPLAWDELGRTDLHARAFTIRNLFDRLSGRDDPWAGLEGHAQALAAARPPPDALLAGARTA
jgi:bifunctional non-homologous end joining protein LigD